jgi:hypothetical protein
MASTTNKNTPGNYAAEQQLFQHHLDYQQYANYGKTDTTFLPGTGLLAGKVFHDNFSTNFIEVEGFLRGTGMSNLVNPKADVKPELIELKSLAIHEKLPVLLPRELVVEKDQRPLWS